MRLREDRIEAISMAIVDALCEEELVDLTIDEEELAHLVHQVIEKDLAREEEIGREAVEWVRVNKPHMDEGGSAWSIELDQRREQIARQRGYLLP